MENTLGKKSNLTDVERNKKIILRFFQDVRLLWLWKQYIVENHINPIVFKKRYVADVLGSLTFTAFAEKTMNKKANSSIFVIFLYYLECMEFKNVPIYHDLNDIEIEVIKRCFKIDKKKNIIKLNFWKNDTSPFI